MDLMPGNMILNINQDNYLIKKKQIVNTNLLKLIILYMVIVIDLLMNRINIKIDIRNIFIINISNLGMIMHSVISNKR